MAEQTTLISFFDCWVVVLAPSGTFNKIETNQQNAEIPPSKAKVLNGGVDLRFSQVDVTLSVSHSCV